MLKLKEVLTHEQYIEGLAYRMEFEEQFAEDIEYIKQLDWDNIADTEISKGPLNLDGLNSLDSFKAIRQYNYPHMSSYITPWELDKWKRYLKEKTLEIVQRDILTYFEQKADMNNNCIQRFLQWKGIIK